MVCAAEPPYAPDLFGGVRRHRRAGCVQTLTTSGHEVTPLAAGTVAWFTPGTIHRLVNEGDLRITVLMQNSACPRRVTRCSRCPRGT